MKFRDRSPNFKTNNLANEIISSAIAIIIIYLLGVSFNLLAGYRSISLLPGIRKSFQYIVNNLVDPNTLFLQNNSLDLQLGLGGIEIVLCLVWFLQTKLLFKLIFFTEKTKKVKQKIKKQSIDTIKLIALTAAVNLIPIVLLQGIRN